MSGERTIEGPTSKALEQKTWQLEEIRNPDGKDRFSSAKAEAIRVISDQFGKDTLSNIRLFGQKGIEWGNMQLEFDYKWSRKVITLTSSTFYAILPNVPLKNLPTALQDMSPEQQAVYNHVVNEVHKIEKVWSGIKKVASADSTPGNPPDNFDQMNLVA